MGGKITVDSQVGAGSTFTFDIPAQPPAYSVDLYSEISKVADAKKFNGSVLVISDVSEVVDMIKGLFDSCGCKTYVARSYRQAFDVYRDTKDISFVILDLDIPGANTLAVELPQIDIQVKIIVVAQPNTSADVLASAPIIGRSVITKPLTADTVANAVNNLLILNNQTLPFDKT